MEEGMESAVAVLHATMKEARKCLAEQIVSKLPLREIDLRTRVSSLDSWVSLIEALERAQRALGGVMSAR